MVYLKNKTLFYIASGGAAVSLGMALYVVRRMKNVYRDSRFFQDTMQILESHAGAVTVLGTPIAATHVDIVPTESGEPTSLAEFTAYVKGPKASGVLHFWAEKKMEEDVVRVHINRVELELSNDKSKRLVVK